MRNYMNGFYRFLVTITAGAEHTAVTFTEAYWARSASAARESAARKWHGAAIGSVVREEAVMLRRTVEDEQGERYPMEGETW